MGNADGRLFSFDIEFNFVQIICVQFLYICNHVNVCC
uniref:Uncharacterized protein n=1 Tax=Anguilla anguilla TaxID=7936 RepID=A0A0E9SA23_ANGAN